MPWNMKLLHKELVGTAPNRQIRMVIEVTDGTNTFTTEMLFNSGDDVSLTGIQAAVKTLVQREVSLIAKSKVLDSYLNQPVPVGI